MTWWAWVVTAGVGPASYLEMFWLALVAVTTYSLAGEFWDACRLRKAAAGYVERWIADGAYYVEVTAMTQQVAWGLIGLVSALSPPPVDVSTEPRRVLTSLVVTCALMGVQVSNLSFTRYRRRNRLRILRALADPPGAGVAVTPMIGGRRAYDLPEIVTED